MSRRATGRFDVQITPNGTQDHADTTSLGRMTVVKQFHGALEAYSKGDMLTGGTSTKGSAAYVVIELVTGKLDGRAGSFALVHRGIMNRGVPELLITVVPDSGTGELQGLSGTLNINVAPDKTHTYELDYMLPDAS